MARGIDILRAFKFKVEVQRVGNKSGFRTFGFSKVSGLSMGSSDIIEYREGNEGIWTRKMPGLHKFNNIIFEKGKSKKEDMWAMEEWRENVSFFRPNMKATSTDYKYNPQYFRNVKVILYSRGGSKKITWELSNAWPVKLDYSDLDAQSSTFLIETVELAYDGVTIIRH
jgi:phage tail-like protein